jgi:MHS family proline/betaine transporter-like MFS transporter
MIVALGAVMLATVTLYILLYLPTYAVRELGLRALDGFRSTLIGGAILFALSPLSGLAADRFGRLAVMTPCALLLGAAPIPLFLWMTQAPASDTLLVSQALLAIVAAGYLGGLPALLTELFPVRSRSTGVSLSYNLSVALFGGLAPFTITWLIALTHSRAAPGYYLSAAAFCSMIALAAVRRLGYR